LSAVRTRADTMSAWVTLRHCNTSEIVSPIALAATQ
jgi:hypothetical protein